MAIAFINVIIPAIKFTMGIEIKDKSCGFAGDEVHDLEVTVWSDGAVHNNAWNLEEIDDLHVDYDIERIRL